ncbi:G-protein coupled receptor Mth2-like isoform X2 [Haematobia irritans]|uniref:G-protein coupled receptor Mth2-like isoform X2 n=1 Tax=Haematobia irritans TaxID=7368 RepID=UPI003F4FA409
MNRDKIYAILVLFTLNIGSVQEVYGEESCYFRDTVDLSNAQKFANGSYLYDNGIVIKPEYVHIYDYVEVFKGKRISVNPHPRGCVCDDQGRVMGEGRLCLKFCCPNPVREIISNSSKHCEAVREHLPYSPYLNVTLTNRLSVQTDVTKDALIISGIPCDKAFPLNRMGDEAQNWHLLENGSLSLFHGEVLLDKRDYCLMFLPKANGKEMILTPRICPEPVENEEPTLHIISSISDFITTIFITLTLLVYLFLTDRKNVQGKCFMCFLITLALGSIFQTIIALPDVIFSKFSCTFMGLSAYYSSIATFCWLNIIGFNMFKMQQDPQDNADSNKKLFLKYSGYSFGLPSLLTLILILIQISNISERYKSGIGEDYCWFDPYNWSALIYFYLVFGILLVLGIAFFVVAFLNLRATLKSHPDSKILVLQMKSANRYGILLVIETIVLFVDVSANISVLLESEEWSVLYYISSFVNTIYGIIIFLIFALEPVKQWRFNINGRHYNRRELITDTGPVV